MKWEALQLYPALTSCSCAPPEDTLAAQLWIQVLRSGLTEDGVNTDRKKHVLSQTSSKHDKGWVRLPCKSRSPTFQLMRCMMLSQLLSLRILTFQGSGKCFWSCTGDKVWLVHLLPAPGNYPSYSSKGTS